MILQQTCPPPRHPPGHSSDSFCYLFGLCFPIVLYKDHESQKWIWSDCCLFSKVSHLWHFVECCMQNECCTLTCLRVAELRNDALHAVSEASERLREDIAENLVKKFPSTPEDRKHGYFWIFPHHSCENIQKYFELSDTFGYSPIISGQLSDVLGGRSPS